MWGFPKIRGTLLGVPIIRIIVYLGLYWAPLILGNYHVTAPCPNPNLGETVSPWGFRLQGLGFGDFDRASSKTPQQGTVAEDVGMASCHRV